MKLNLGSGLKNLDGYVNIDIRQEVNPDIVCNVENGLPYRENTVDEVRAFDFLEHLWPDKRLPVIEEIFRVLKPGGILEHHTPSTDGRGFGCDPTHYSAWNIVSWLYYTHDAYRAIYGIKAKFEAIELRDIITDPYLNIVHTYGRLKAVKNGRDL